MDRDRPVVVQGVRNAIAIASGGRASLALLADGTVMTWGVIPRDESKPAPVPSLVAGVRGIRAIAAGFARARRDLWTERCPIDCGKRRDDNRRPCIRPDHDVGRRAALDAAR
jgi:alpha-tubulin suppressor-like RCC1 family protein